MTTENQSVRPAPPPTWRTETLRDVVVTLRNGTTAPQNQNGIGLPVSRIETISDGRIDYTKVRHLKSHPDGLDAYRLDPGDVLLSHINSIKHIGKVARYDGAHTLIHGMNLIRVVFDRQRIDPLFGYYSLSDPRAKHYFERRAKKAINQASLNRTDIGGLPIHLPPRAEQRKIASILSSMDGAIAKTGTVIDHMRVVRRGLMQELLTRGVREWHATDTSDLPSGWKLNKIGDLGEIITGSTPRTNNSMFWNGTIPFVTPSDLGHTREIDSAIRNVSEKGLAQVRAIPAGAVMVTCIASIGKLGIAKTRCCTNQQINSIIPDTSIVHPEYLYYAMLFASSKLIELAGKTAVPIVSKGRFAAMNLAIPTIAEQREIGAILASLDQVIHVNETRRVALAKTRLGLISRLLAGELRVGLDSGTD